MEEVIIAEMEVFNLSYFLDFYSDSLQSKYDNQILCVSGFYKNKKGRAYSGFCYDELFDTTTKQSLTLKIDDRTRKGLNEGDNYTMSGYIKRDIKKNGSVNLCFQVAQVINHNKEEKLFKDEDFNLLKDRFNKGFEDVKEKLTDKIESGKKPNILIVTGSTSIVMADFYNQLGENNLFNIEEVKVNLSASESIIKYIDSNSSVIKKYDILVIMRGGGTGLEVFDDEKLCKKIIDLNTTFSTALGHEKDKPFLEKLSDKSFATPSAFGAFLNKISESRLKKIKFVESTRKEVEEKLDEIKELKSINKDITEMIISGANERDERMNSLIKKNSKLRTGLIFLVAVLIAVIGYLILSK